ncbi:MAG: hypothetical protein PHX80_04350 [Candidatus Nanoarchaeia archaeon]|nr:hypothetical protein [Candidatus Nanoarchaeia archaeon]
MGISRKKELESIIKTARGELSKLEDKETEKRNSKLIGKYYKYRTCYSFPNDESDYWYIYMLVVKSKGASLYGWRFETDKYGKIEIDFCCELNGYDPIQGWTEITSDIFRKEWRKVESNISITSNELLSEQE